MILIGLGANLPSRFGAPPATLAAALSALTAKGLTIEAQSRIWLTAPVPVSDQPWYHNAVIAVTAPLQPPVLLTLLQSVENEFGRVRHLRNEPRVIDLDLLAYDDKVLQSPDLTLPHPRLHERGFVLLPLRDIAPGWTHPVSGMGISDLIAALSPEQTAQPLEDIAWP